MPRPACAAYGSTEERRAGSVAKNPAQPAADVLLRGRSSGPVPGARRGGRNRGGQLHERLFSFGRWIRVAVIDILPLAISLASKKAGDEIQKRGTFGGFEGSGQ